MTKTEKNRKKIVIHFEFLENFFVLPNQKLSNYPNMILMIVSCGVTIQDVPSLYAGTSRQKYFNIPNMELT